MRSAALVRASRIKHVARPAGRCIRSASFERNTHVRSTTTTTTAGFIPQVRCFSSSNDSLVPKQKGDGAIVPIDFDVASKVEGEESQIVTISLEPGQVLRAESGAMIYMTSGVQMETSANGVSEGFKRLMTGQNVFVSDYTYTGDAGSGTVALGTDFPSKILRLNLDELGGKLVCQRGAYLAGSHTVQIEMEFAKKFSTGFFGGEGFVLQALTGSGDVFVKAGGTLVKKELQDGETLRVSSGSLVAFTQDVDFDVQTMPGFKNVLFGGEGLFVTTLTGPGTVWMQGMPPDRMISEIARRIPGGGGIGLGVPIGVGGSEAAAGEPGEEESEQDMVAATDADVDADRQATVASSGLGDSTDSSAPIDADSPSALFGDAAPPEQESSSFGVSSDEVPDFDDASSFSTDDSAQFGDEPKLDEFQDDSSFSSFDEDPAAASDVFDTGAADDGGGGSSIFSTLWDLFTGGDE